MSFHGLLDWRLGLSLLRMFADPAYNCGLDGERMRLEVSDWLPLAADLRHAFCSAFRCAPRTFGSLPGFEVAGRNVVLAHPLWDTNAPSLVLAEAVASAPGARLEFVDTFNVQRRMSSVYQASPTSGLLKVD